MEVSLHTLGTVARLHWQRTAGPTIIHYPTVCGCPSTAGTSASRPIRHLLQSGTIVNYVPPAGTGCELQVTATAEKSDSRWWNRGPVITGQVKILNPKEYGIPVANVQVTAQSSDGQFYMGYANCGNGSPSTYVPMNPIPYTYGECHCC